MLQNFKQLHIQKHQSLPAIPIQLNQQQFKLMDIDDLSNIIAEAKKLQHYFMVKEFYIPQSKAKYFIIKIRLEGREEQKIFETNPQFINIFRRGLTILFGNLNDRQFNVVDNANYQIIRKGLPKFYELEDNWDVDLKLRNPFLYQNQLHRAYQSLQLKIPITLVEQQQENGENCQISYSSTLQAWAISSKNVTLLFKDKQDIKHRVDGDFENYERLPNSIAELWFEYIKDINQEQLQNDLGEKTLIGEFVNNPFFNHFVNYEKSCIIFFAVIENKSTKLCCHTQSAEYLADKYHFPFVKTKYYQIEDQHYLDFHLKRIQEQVKSKPISIQGEGVVIYLFNVFECLSIFKIKTIEYKQHKLFRTKLLSVFKEGFLGLQSFLDAYEQEADDLNQFQDRDIDKLIEINKIILLHLLQYIIEQKQSDAYFTTTMQEMIGKNYYTFYVAISNLANSICINDDRQENIFKKFPFNQKKQTIRREHQQQIEIDDQLQYYY